jgi:hypothetical protein
MTVGTSRSPSIGGIQDTLVVKTFAELLSARDAVETAGGGIIKFDGVITMTSEVLFAVGNVSLIQSRHSKIIPAFDAGGFAQAGNHDALFRFKATAPVQLTDGLTSASIAAGAVTVALSATDAADVEIGDWLAFVSDQIHAGASTSSTSYYGESGRVVAKDGDTVVLNRPFTDGVPGPATIDIYRVPTLKNIVIDGLYVENARVDPNDEKYAQIVTLHGVESARVRGVYASEGAPGGFVFRDAFNSEIADCKIDSMSHRVVGGRYIADQNYGVVVTGYGHGIDVANCRMNDVRHGFTTGSGNNGHPTGIRVLGGEYHVVGRTCLDTHVNGFVLFEGVTASVTSLPSADPNKENNGTGGKAAVSRSPNTVFRKCDFSANNIACQSQADNVVFDDCTVTTTGALSIGIHLGDRDTGIGPDGCQIRRCRFPRTGANGIDMGNSTNTLVVDNEFYNTSSDQVGSHGHILIQAAAGATITRNLFTLAADHNYSLRDNRGTSLVASPLNKFYDNVFVGFPAPDAGKGVVKDGVRFEDNAGRKIVLAEAGSIVDGTLASDVNVFHPEHKYQSGDLSPAHQLDWDWEIDPQLMILLEDNVTVASMTNLKEGAHHMVRFKQTNSGPMYDVTWSVTGLFRLDGGALEGVEQVYNTSTIFVFYCPDDGSPVIWGWKLGRGQHS